MKTFLSLILSMLCLTSFSQPIRSTAFTTNTAAVVTNIVQSIGTNISGLVGPWKTNAAFGGYTNQAGVFMLNNGAIGSGTFPDPWWYINSIDASISFGSGSWTLNQNGAASINGVNYTFPSARGPAKAFLQDVAANGTLTWGVDGGGLTNLSSASLSALFSNSAWVDATNGSDSTGILRNPSLPFRTIMAAHAAGAAAGGQWFFNILPGTYTDTNLQPHGVSYNLIDVWQPEAIWTATNSGHLYNLSNATNTKPFYVLGHGRFYSKTASGQFLTSTYATTRLSTFYIEGDKIDDQGSTASSSFFDFRGTMNSTDPINGSTGVQNNCLRFNSIDCRARPCYFRLAGDGASPFFMIHADYVGGVKIDQGNFMVRCGYAEAFQLGPNNFGPGQSLLLNCVYRFKATATPALTLRAGQAIIDCPNMEVTDGAAACILIPSNADTSDGIQLHLKGVRFKQWASGTFPAIQFAAANSNYRVRLQDCEIICANSPTNAITATGAQTIEVINGLTSNVALSTNITVRGGPVTIDANLWTNF